MEAGSSKVTVRYFAGARAAAGVPEDVMDVPGGATVADVLQAAVRERGERLGQVLGACSFLLDGVAVRDRSIVVTDGGQLDVLPPFAGG
ncbi:putative molybdenum cofactor biosynthesis protein D2 (MoaD2) / thiamineS [Longimycelium tulufanense]|uniref:Molybdopterin synthase sulfur carrier subunit n=1 Tax=Longimycelium tulufanense TaxID=907463 RepID=A0A8J3CAB7_9PSEU|nr:putative molybdenum cofactor biosynthesis protein D2 (MoaD2) / thiamineS [Longimycelium tulufanense]